eukprot:NODE_827_length_1753_cov_20.857981_g679_i0.p1 GENE.NODE_827_length_1753_cov_20.857981_g679_i0~~NODE_827_length_1753_cov_20.857981_g679_i0.p1  ORF type:complete len:572 (+),score=51.66 NODE_827_length_1753_cov_20.857981_g679_i0:164-1717(+)
MWAIGCIMGELIDGQPLFPGKSELDQLYLIQRTIGDLTSDQVVAFQHNPRFKAHPIPSHPKAETIEKRYLGKMTKQMASFMKGLLQMDPANRLSIDQAYQHPYFSGLHDALPYVKRPSTPSTGKRSAHLAPGAPPAPPQPNQHGVSPQPSSTSLSGPSAPPAGQLPGGGPPSPPSHLPAFPPYPYPSNNHHPQPSPSPLEEISGQKAALQHAPHLAQHPPQHPPQHPQPFHGGHGGGPPVDHPSWRPAMDTDTGPDFDVDVPQLPPKHPADPRRQGLQTPPIAGRGRVSRVAVGGGNSVHAGVGDAPPPAQLPTGGGPNYGISSDIPAPTPAFTEQSGVSAGGFRLQQEYPTNKGCFPDAPPLQTPPPMPGPSSYMYSQPPNPVLQHQNPESGNHLVRPASSGASDPAGRRRRVKASPDVSHAQYQGLPAYGHHSPDAPPPHGARRKDSLPRIPSAGPSGSSQKLAQPQNSPSPAPPTHLSRGAPKTRNSGFLGGVHARGMFPTGTQYEHGGKAPPS